MYRGQIPILVTGRRKATARWCARCQQWHATPRGLGVAGCPADVEVWMVITPDSAETTVTTVPSRPSRVPAHIRRARLGSRSPQREVRFDPASAGLG